MKKWKKELEFSTQSIIDAVYSIQMSSIRPDIYSILKTLVKDNATKIYTSIALEVKNMVENGLLENTKTCQR